MVSPERFTRSLPVVILVTESEINSLMSLAASADRCASVLTSLATTAKPRPCSPALAASTAALRARIFVWKAMPSITPMISEMRWADAFMADMVSTTCLIMSPPSAATVQACDARLLACSAFSAFSFTVPFSSSMLEEVSSRLDACCSVREDRSALPVAISDEAVLIVSTASLISPMVDRML